MIMKYAGDIYEALPNLGKEIQTKAYHQGREDAIEEYHKEIHDIIEGNEEFIDWQKHEILMCNDLVLEQLKEQKNGDK